MLKVENIQYSIDKKEIVRNISAEFLPGEFNVILGPNGSGKSTFLKIFSGEINGYSGSVFYNQTNISKEKKEMLAKCRAVLSQQPELSFPLTVDEVIMMGRYPHFHFSPTKKDIAICNEVIDKLDLSVFKERKYLTLSGGEKQRVQLARILTQIWETDSSTVRYLFLDEPLNNLDISHQQEILQLTKEFTGSNTVIVAVLHDINLAAQYADKLFFLKDGQLLAQGKPAEVLTPGLLLQVFNTSTTIIQNPVSSTPLVLFHTPGNQL